MRKIWRKDKHKGSIDQTSTSSSSASFTNRNPSSSIPTIDENSTTDVDTLKDVSVHGSAVDLSSYTKNSNSIKYPLSRSETLVSSLSSLQGGRRSTLGKSSKLAMNSLVKAEWDTKTIKSGWMNRAGSEFNDDSLKLFRVELKGSHLQLYKLPSELYNVKNFRIALEGEELLEDQDQYQEQQLQSQQSQQDDNNLTINSSLSDLPQPKHLDQSLVSSSPTLTQDLNSLRKPSVLNNPELNGSFDDGFNLNHSSDDVHSMKSKMSYPMLSMFSGSHDDLSQYSLSLSPSKTPSASTLIIPTVRLTYFSAKYPHPNLVIDEFSQFIISGDLESICHAILFNTFVHTDGDNDRVTKHLLFLLPLLGDICTALLYFKKYSDIFFSSSQPGSVHKETFEEILLIPKKTELIMAQRIILVVDFIKDNFPGMLLEQSIFKAIWDLLPSISNHINCSDLSEQVHEKQQQLFLLFHQVEDADLNAIINDDLQGANFLKMDLSELATEINNINLSFNKTWNPQLDCSLLFESIHENYSYYRKNPLIFDSSKNIHYLGRLLINHIFLDSNFSKTPSKRAKIIKKWVELGSHFDKIGDMVSWLAIATIICSVPVLRLRKTWDFIDPEVIRIISTDWAPVVFELDRRSMISDASHRSSYHVIAPQGIGELYPKENVIPYFGDLYVKNSDAFSIKQCERKAQRVVISLNRWKEYVLKVENNSDMLSYNSYPPRPNPTLSSMLYGLLNYHISCPNLTLESIMTVSLDIEPSTNGTFHKFHNNSRSPLFLGSYPSVIFPEVLPKYKVYDQKVLIGAIGNESTSDNAKSNQLNVVNSISTISGINVTATSNIKANRSNEQRPGRNIFLKNLRDIFNIESWDLHVSDSIIFKAMIPEQDSDTPASSDLTYETGSLLETEHDLNSDAANTSKPRSRPSSVLFNESANTKRYSNYSTNLNDFQTQVNKVKDIEHIYEMFTKAATLDRLIDLLVLTSNIFVSEIDKDDVQMYFNDLTHKSKNYNFKMDNGVYTVTFFATYRSFCSTIDLLKSLLKRFLGARSAAISIFKRREELVRSGTASAKIDDDYPSWTNDPDDHEDEKIVWKYVAQIQIGILEALITLVRDHYDHFIDDLSIRKTFVDILKIIDNEVIIEWTSVLSDLELQAKLDDLAMKQFLELQEHYDQILALYKKVRKSYIKRSYKPAVSEFKSPNFSCSIQSVPTENSLPSSTNIGKIENFINEFDELVSILFSRISVDDLLNVFEIIEVQASKTTGLFNYQMQKINTPDENLIVSDIFGWFASLYDTNEFGLTKGYAVNKFPASVRSIIQLYYKLKTFFVAQIIDPCISQDLRIDRMRSLLILLVMSRYKMKGVDLFNLAALENCEVSPHVPSLIETALINSIISPESRLFAESWIIASNSLDSKDNQKLQCDTLECLLPKSKLFDEDSLKSHKTLTPCIGWLSERLVEIACYIPNMSVANTKLINFDKRRYVYNCISNILDMKETYEGEAVTNIENFKFLFKLKDDELFNIDEVKKTALRESKSQSQNVVILFQHHLDEERNILRKEHSKKKFLTKQEQEKKNAALRETAALRAKQLNSNGVAAHATSKLTKRQSILDSPTGKSRFKFSIFNKQAKSFSFVGSTNPDRVVRNIDLPDATLYLDPKQKPYTVINLKDMSIFPIYRVPAAFKIGGGPNDGEYFFQALTEADKEEWIYQLNYSRRHWYFSKSLNKNISSNLIFGVPIEFICLRESSLIPNIIDKLMTEIEVRGLEEVGIYRKSASLSVLHLLRNEIDKSGDFNMENHLIFDINNATGCIKLFLRDIPDSLIPDELIPEFGEVRQDNFRFEGRLKIYKEVLPKVPYHNYHLLKRLIRHLKVVDEFSEFNKMTASNLSTIIGATFTEGASPELTKKYFGLMNFVCEDMIKHYDVIFENDDQFI